MTTAETAVWQPQFVLDLSTARGKAFEELTTEFEKWAKEHPLPEFTLKDGWVEIIPQMAEELLQRNPKGANRKALLPTVLYYGAQMKRGDWPKTGQALIFDEDGILLDGQHRLWACYLSGASFFTYVVTNVPKHNRLFAYIDNGKSRSAANALQTAGLNGVSPLLVKVLDYIYAYNHGLFSVNSVQQRERFSPVQYLDMLEANPNVRTAGKLAVSEYSEASDLAEREVVAFSALMIISLYDETVADQFFNELGGTEATDEDGVIEALRKLLIKDANKLTGRMKKHQKLGNLIKAFNLWIAHEQPKKNWSLRVDEKFPRFAEPETTEISEAAE